MTNKGLARIPGKALASNPGRSALVNISNKTTANTNINLKNAVPKGKSNISKISKTTSLKTVDKENPAVKSREEAIKVLN